MRDKGYGVHARMPIARSAFTRVFIRLICVRSGSFNPSRSPSRPVGLLPPIFEDAPAAAATASAAGRKQPERSSPALSAAAPYARQQQQQQQQQQKLSSAQRVKSITTGPFSVVFVKGNASPYPPARVLPPAHSPSHGLTLTRSQMAKSTGRPALPWRKAHFPAPKA
jgi:hypothetical protein